MELGAKTSQEAVEVKRGAVVPGQCCSLIYTSGTTGNPKAVMISHDSCTWTAKVAFEDVFGLGREEHVVSYLPLSHIAAQLMDIISPMVNEVTVHFARPDALKGSIRCGNQPVCRVHPTILH
jgi:long-chain-fatty-acid--CoA ligase ACSBG